MKKSEMKFFERYINELKNTNTLINDLKDSNNYEIGIYYSLGKPVIIDYDSESNPIYKVKITKDMNLFKIVAGIYNNLSNVKDFKATEELLKDKLTGKTFKAEVGTAYNGGFLIEPTELLE